jgi:hypothetical protein
VTAATLADNGDTVVESASAGAIAMLSTATVSDGSVAGAAAASASAGGADGVTAFVVGAVTEADAPLLGVDAEVAVGVASGWAAGGSSTSVIGCGSAVSVGDAGVPVSSGVLVLPAVPVVVWALTTPGATVFGVLLVVVLVVLVVVVLVVIGSGWDSVDAISGPAVPAVSVDCTVPVDELSDGVDSSAQATPCPVAIAVPTPSATARRPTRPT